MKSNHSAKLALAGAVSSLALTAGLSAWSPASAIVVNNNLTPTQAIDTNNVTGVGQMVIDQKNGFIGLCTATLINPRTVIFAAHCVNENPAGNGFQPASGYGAKNGGLPIGFFFNVNNNAAGNSAIGQWLNGVAGGPKDLTRVANNAYNSNWVWYNPASTSLGLGNNFLQGDVALAALDTPASKIPTWTLLFSPITSAQHVTITGYGNNGVGTTGGTGGIDFRRRVAENMVSVLGSLDDQDRVLFGAPDGLPQNLYMLDFNDPKYGKTGASPFDFNIFHDAALPKEGITAPGDSGGPLIVDQAYSRPVIIGVLSGGDRFFGAQPSASYGTTSFYQPLYLFWDLIVANNPYKYVGSLAGDAKWTDPTHWVINTDPNFLSLDAKGNLVNALPTTAGAGVTGTQPKFGFVCFQNDCININTGVETIFSAQQPAAGSAPAVVSVSKLSEAGAGGLQAGGVASTPGVVSVAQVSEAGGNSAATASVSSVGATSADPSNSTFDIASSQVSEDEFNAVKLSLLALASPTLANGLPGATNFVPNDTDGAPASNIPPRYYDVTLAAAGTTTLDTAVTVDRLTISGSSAALNITSGGSLTSLIDTTVNAGTLNVDGTYTSVGDIALIGGLLSGSGTINSGHTTSVLGTIAPGGLAKIGTLTFQGDVILSSGSRLQINVGAGGQASRIVSQANAAQGTTGIVNLGGLLAITGAGGYVPHYGDNYLVVSAAGGVTGNFNAVTAISQGVLVPNVVVSANAVNVQVTANSYTTVTNANSPVQAAYAKLLDGDRGNYSKLSGIYDQLDNMPASVLQPTLETLAPFHVIQARDLATMSTEALADLYRDRIDEGRSAAEKPGTLAVIGQPIAQLAALDQKYQPGGMSRTLTDAAPTGSAPTAAMPLPNGINAFLAAGYLDGSGAALPSLVPGAGKNSIDGYYIAGGIEVSPNKNLSVGASIGYARTSASLLSLDKTDQNLKSLAVYGSYTFKNGMFLTGQGTVAQVTSKTKRVIPVGGAVFNLAGKGDGKSFTGEIDTGRDYKLKGAPKLTFTPIVGLRYEHFNPGDITETGGAAALSIPGKGVSAFEGRVGLNAKGDYAWKDMTVTPKVTAAYVHDFKDPNASVYADFAGGVGQPVGFGAPKHTKDWGEIGGAVTLKGKMFDVSVGAKSNLGRKEVDYQTYTASVRFRF